MRILIKTVSSPRKTARPFVYQPNAAAGDLHL